MIVVKYFAEEPASFEPASGLSAPSLESFLARPRLYRGYLSATDMRTLRSGATVADAPPAWALPVVEAFQDRRWWAADGDLVKSLDDPASALLAASIPVIVASALPPEPESLRQAERELDLSGPEGRIARCALAATGHVVFWRETGFDGFDWGLLADVPIAETIRAVFEARPAPDVRRFVIPLREARGEHRFHFERYDLDAFGRYRIFN